MTERNLITQETYQYYDEHGLLLVKDDPESKKDTIGRTVKDLITKGRNKKMEQGLRKCQGEKVIWRFGYKIQFTLKRHPDLGPSSRDHWQYYIIFRRIVHTTDRGFKFFVDHLPYLPGLSIWARTLTGDPFAEAIFYCSQIPGAWIGNAWNKFVRVIGCIEPEMSAEEWNEYGTMTQKSITGWIRFWRKGLIPTFSLEGKAWQLWILPDSPDKELLKRILLKRVGKYNYFLRLMFGDTTVTREEVENYKHMTNWRWGVSLDQSNDRYTVFLKYPALLQFNALETDALEWAFNNKGK